LLIHRNQGWGVIISGLLAASAIFSGWYAFQAAHHARVLVSWRTASEVDVAGFRLYRAEQPEGPFIPITKQLIPAKGDPYTGSNYSFVDAQVLPGKSYSYQLEDIDLKGNSSIHSLQNEIAQAGGKAEAALALSLAVLCSAWIYYSRRPASAQAGG
jgi:hypothetical protein